MIFLLFISVILFSEFIKGFFGAIINDVISYYQTKKKQEERLQRQAEQMRDRLNKHFEGRLKFYLSKDFPETPVDKPVPFQ